MAGLQGRGLEAPGKGVCRRPPREGGGPQGRRAALQRPAQGMLPKGPVSSPHRAALRGRSAGQLLSTPSVSLSPGGRRPGRGASVVRCLFRVPRAPCALAWRTGQESTRASGRDMNPIPNGLPKARTNCGGGGHTDIQTLALTHAMGGNLLCPKPTRLNLNLIQKTPSQKLPE